MIEVLIVFIVILIINDELMVDIYSSCKPSVVISFHSFAIQLTSGGHFTSNGTTCYYRRGRRLLIITISADDGLMYHYNTDS
jgi:hypothetical protein